MKKKILFFLTSLSVGGTEKVIVTYINELSKEPDYELILCVMFQLDCVDTLENTVSSSVKILYLCDVQTGNQFHRRYLNYQKSYLDKVIYGLTQWFYNITLEHQFKNIVLDNKPDILVQGDSGMPQYISKYKDLKTIIFVHFSVDHLYSRFFKKLRTKLWINRLKGYKYVVTIAEVMFKQLKHFCSENQLVLIYNPIQKSKILALSQENLILPLGIEKNNYIVSIGRLDENQKDFAGLINSIAYIRNKYSIEYKLLIVGEGRDRTTLESLVYQNKLENQIYFIGNQINPYPYIKHSNLLVLSTKFEGLPTVLLEALLLNKLAISSDCFTGPAEILNHKQLLAPIGEKNALAEKIHNLLQNEELQAEMYAHLMKQKQYFNPTKSIEKMKKIF